MRVLIVGHAWPQVDRRQQRPGRRLPPAQRRAALPPSLPSAHAGRALAAALAALRRALVDAAATANLLAHAAALAALAAAAPDLAARPLCRSTAAVPVSGRVSFRVSCSCTLPVLV